MVGKVEHTPGPWMYDDDRIGVSDSPHDSEPFITSVICDMVGDHITTDENDANARLIAAAPDMLEALKLFERYASFYETKPNYTLGPEEVATLEAARSAIAKAEGGV